MSLKKRIEDDLKAALLSGDRQLVEVLRGLKATVLNEEVAKGKRDEGLADEDIESLIAREVKKRIESANIYEKANREELAVAERSEAEILGMYLPDQLSEEEITTVVNRVIRETNANSPAAMGQVIGMVKKELGNKADGALIAKIAKNALN